MSSNVTSPYPRRSVPYLRPIWLLLAVVCWLSAAGAQPVPDTILLPDSLGPLHQPYHVTFGGSSNNIYVASESSDIIVVDGSTFQRIKRINTGTPVGGVLLVAQHDKMYCSHPAQGRVGVIDCATNSIVGSIPVGAGPKALCYSSGSDKLYCGDSVGNTVSVIDCTADTVVTTIALGSSLGPMEYDPTTNKVYVATADALLAIGCQVDTVVASIAEIKAARGLCISSRHQHLYAVEPRYAGSDTVFVVSTPADSVTAAMWVPNEGFLLPRLACNDANDRLYGMLDWGGGGDWYIAEFDCTGDSWTRCQGVGSPRGLALVCDTARNRLLYLSVDDGGWGYVSEYDCATLARLSSARVSNYANILELDTVRRRVLCGGGELNAVLSVLECNDDSLTEVGEVPLSGWQSFYSGMCHNPVAGKLYWRWGDGGGGVGVVDEQTNRVVAQTLLPQQESFRHMAFSLTSNKLYCSTSTGLAVLDGTGDSLLKSVDLGISANSPRWYQNSNKLYCQAKTGERWYVAVLDCYTDSVVREIDLVFDNYSLALVGDDCLLCWGLFGRLTLVDCRTDSILADSALPGNMYAAAYSGDDKVYVIHHYSYDRLEARSAPSLSLLATVDWPYSRTADQMFLVCSDSTHRLYWFAHDWRAKDSVLVIDTRSDTVVARMQVNFAQRFGCLDRTGTYIFCSSPDSNSLVVYDTRSDSVAAVYATPPSPIPVVPNPELGLIYVGCADAILAYPDTLVIPGVCEKPAPPAKRLPPTILRASDANRMGPAAWYDVTGRRISSRTADGARRAVSPGVYLAPGLGRRATKVVVVR